MTELCRRHGISDATFYTWHSRYGGLEVSEMRRLRQLEEENRRLRRRWGCPMLYLMLRREGWCANRKRVERLYREEGLSLRKSRFFSVLR